jgi:cytokinin dehydrogenase
MTRETAFDFGDLESALSSPSTTEVGDFGGLSTGVALATATPRSESELSALVQLARRRGFALTPRGLGRSQSGQSVPNESVVLDLSQLNAVGEVDTRRRTIRCQGGATVRQVVAETLPHGLLPLVCPLNLDLSVGGLLSAGGVGTTSHRHGFAASHVASAQVVLGSGECVTTGPDQERNVYDAVFGGVGRAGAIAAAELLLEEVPKRMHTVSLEYRDIDSLLEAQLRLAADPRVLHLDGACSAAVLGTRVGPGGRREPIRRWMYVLHASLPVGEAESLLNSLDFASLIHAQDDDTAEFVTRFDGRFQWMRASGAWSQTHPWFEAFVPRAQAREVIERALSLPAFLGDLVRVAPISSARRPLSIAFPDAEPCVAVAVLPVGVPAPLSHPALDALGQLDGMLAERGGKRYLSGWLFDTSARGWQRHYGGAHARLLASCQRFNPDRTFRTRLGFC